MVQKRIYDLIFDLSEKIRGLEAERDALRKIPEGWKFSVAFDPDGYIIEHGESHLRICRHGGGVEYMFCKFIDAAIAAKEPNRE